MISKLLRTLILPVLSLSLATSSTAGENGHERDEHRDRGDTYAIGLWGDLPSPSLTSIKTRTTCGWTSRFRTPMVSAS